MIKFLKKYTPATLRVTLPAVLAGLAVYYYNQVPIPDPARATVKITRFQGGGGSGSIIAASPTGSQILTNRHVCNLLEAGGIVEKIDGSTYQVTEYTVDTIHDLCLVYVSANLGESSTVAVNPPELYSAAAISGHPRLLPNVISTGHFGGYTKIKLVTRIETCTKAHLARPNGRLICGFIRGWPVFEQYESQVITATIMGGSSGSGVYDSNGDIAAVAFAGMRGLSYALAVPHGYIVTFLARAPYLAKIKPSNEMDLTGTPIGPTISAHEYVTSKCQTLQWTEAEAIQEMCKDLLP